MNIEFFKNSEELWSYITAENGEGIVAKKNQPFQVVLDHLRLT
ncbi:hypothetical protein [Schinkia azotoformans]|nr:hypothetical protein [Schinkia azotoformans]MEC1718680.1 hypothetical protein [Schinkia azotoformans]MEC1739349.1 hypothetical protein [Schinkia azotoformans]MEC1746494.1 hypothetical protein [Schinkia azotoformans]MEC1760246.1 hypothetical protein [Schinkia azotoformans]MEC1765911.1 hypothetical protein [Schinkia azotoformans]